MSLTIPAPQMAAPASAHASVAGRRRGNGRAGTSFNTVGVALRQTRTSAMAQAALFASANLWTVPSRACPAVTAAAQTPKGVRRAQTHVRHRVSTLLPLFVVKTAHAALSPKFEARSKSAAARTPWACGLGSPGCGTGLCGSEERPDRK